MSIYLSSTYNNIELYELHILIRKVSEKYLTKKNTHGFFVFKLSMEIVLYTIIYKSFHYARSQGCNILVLGYLKETVESAKIKKIIKYKDNLK